MICSQPPFLLPFTNTKECLEGWGEKWEWERKKVSQIGPLLDDKILLPITFFSMGLCLGGEQSDGVGRGAS